MSKLKQLINWLICGFIFLLPLQTRWIYRQGELKGMNWEYGTFSLYATELLFFVILVLAVIVVIGHLRTQDQQQSKNATLSWILLASVFVIATLNIWTALNWEIAFYKWAQIISVGALFFIVVSLKLDFKKIAWAFVFSGLVQGGLAIQQFVEQKVVASKWLGMAEQLPTTLGVPIVQIGAERWLRAFGSSPHPNMLAGFLVVSLIFTVSLLFLTENPKRGQLLLAIFVVNFLGLLTALSRAAFIVFILALIFILIIAYRETAFKQKVRSIGVMTLFILSAFFISYPELVISRVNSDSRVERISNATRLEQYDEWRQIMKTDWLLGVGLGNYTLALSKLKSDAPTWADQPIHNVYFLVIAELGLFGLLLSLLFFIYIVMRLFKLTKFILSEKVVCLICLVGLALLAFFDHYLLSFWSGLMLLSLIFAFTIPSKQLTE